MMICAIIAAGGNSTRFGDDKLELRLKDKPVLAWSVKLLSTHPQVQEVVVACADIEKTKKLLHGHTGSNVSFVEGGDCRQKSVLNALKSLPDCDVVLIHDGARPFASSDIIDKLISEAKGYSCMIPVIPCTSAVKIIAGNEVSAHHMGKFNLAQTPQLVWREPLAFAMEKYASRLQDFPDESSLVAEAGFHVGTVHGSPFNIKITYPDDLSLAQAIVAYLRK
jgi:2-C-methyl-D-erythritol 4-phosphate cytidylyltransferase